MDKKLKEMEDDILGNHCSFLLSGTELDLPLIHFLGTTQPSKLRSCLAVSIVMAKIIPFLSLYYGISPLQTKPKNGVCFRALGHKDKQSEMDEEARSSREEPKQSQVGFLQEFHTSYLLQTLRRHNFLLIPTVWTMVVFKLTFSFFSFECKASLNWRIWSRTNGPRTAIIEMHEGCWCHLWLMTWFMPSRCLIRFSTQADRPS